MGKDINKVLEKYFGVFLLTSLIWLLFFQNPLESIHPLFKYIDEVVTLVGLIGVIIFIRQYGLQLMSVKFVFITLFLFTIVGLVGNAIYQYQNLKSVLIDTYTNLKFFFAFDVLYFLKNIDYKKSIKVIQINSRLIVGLMFVIFVLDRYLKMFPGEIRYGIRSSALMFSHPTYLAGALAFLVGILTISFTHKTRNVECFSYIYSLALFLYFDFDH